MSRPDPPGRAVVVELNAINQRATKPPGLARWETWGRRQGFSVAKAASILILCTAGLSKPQIRHGASVRLREAVKTVRPPNSRRRPNGSGHPTDHAFAG